MSFPKFRTSKNRKIEPTPATSATREQTKREQMANVATVATVAGGPSESGFFEDLYFEFEERAAIISEGCDLPQAQATELAAIEFGFACGKELYEGKIGRRPAN
jgi:hypothetical protein